MFKKIAATLCAFLLGALALGTQAISAEPTKGGVVVIGYQAEPDTMNTYSTHMLADVQHCVVEGLLIPDGEMLYRPVLVNEVPTLENGLIKLTDDGKMTITYNLKKGVKWHDGKPFTAADVKFTWEAVKDPAFLAEGKDGTDDIESIETPDDHTVVCYYKTPVADFAEKLFTFGILPKHLCEGTDLNQQTGYNRHPVGTGPFKFEEWKSGEYIKLVRNPDYHVEGKPYLDGFVFKFINDQNTQVAQLKTGEVHFVMNLPYHRYDEIKAIPGVKVLTKEMNAWTHLDFNLNHPVLADKAVRKAIALAVDKEAIVTRLFGGIPKAWNSSWQPMDRFYNPNLPKHVYDPEKAKQILEEAGWKVGANGIREKDGMKLEFGFGVRSGFVDDEKVQQVLIASVKNIGVGLSATNAAMSTITAKWFKGEYDIKMHRWITGPGASRTRFYATDAMPPNGINTVFWVSEKATELMKRSDSVMDFEKRKALLWEVQEIMLEEMPTLPIYNNVAIIALHEKLGGVVPNSTNMTNFWDSGSWYFSK